MHKPPDGSIAACRLIQDVSLPLRRPARLWFAVLNGVIFGTVIAFTSVGAGLRASPAVFGLALGALAATLLAPLRILARLHMRRRIDRFVIQRAGEPWEEFIAQRFSQSPIDGPDAAAEFLSRLARAGKAGVVLRSDPQWLLGSIEPIFVPFEPIPLWQQSPAFRGLEGLAGSGGYTTPARTQAGSAWEGRRIRLSVLVTLIAFGVMIGINLWRSIAAWRISWDLFGWLILAAIIVGAVARRPAWRTNKQWALVPGGLVRRRAAWLAQRWELHLFDRRTSNLLVFVRNGQFWFACIADAAERDCIQLRGVEARMLLRAWLSPLVPPRPEQLSDLV